MSDQTITSLIEKLEGAEVGSRELDRQIHSALFGTVWLPWRESARKCWGFSDENRTKVLVYEDYPHDFTTSLDAALALAERLELSVGEILNDALEGPAGVGIWQSGWNGTISTIPQIARFVCIAILRAQSEARATGEDSPANSQPQEHRL